MLDKNDKKTKKLEKYMEIDKDDHLPVYKKDPEGEQSSDN